MTAQYQDALYYQGRWQAINETPLEDYLDGLPQRPAFPVYMSSLWRGYIGKWVIDDEKLYLNQLENIEIGLTPSRPRMQVVPNPVTVDSIFPEAAGARVLADWYTGRLQFPQDDGKDPAECPSGEVNTPAVCIDVYKGSVVYTSVKQKPAHRSRLNIGAYAHVECASCQYEGAIPIPKDRGNDWRQKTRPVWCKDCGELTLSDDCIYPARCAECGSENISRTIMNQRPLALGVVVWGKFVSGITQRLRRLVTGNSGQAPLAKNISTGEFAYRCPQCGQLSLKFE